MERWPTVGAGQGRWHLGLLIVHMRRVQTVRLYDEAAAIRALMRDAIFFGLLLEQARDHLTYTTVHHARTKDEGRHREKRGDAMALQSRRCLAPGHALYIHHLGATTISLLTGIPRVTTTRDRFSEFHHKVAHTVTLHERTGQDSSSKTFLLWLPTLARGDAPTPR